MMLIFWVIPLSSQENGSGPLPETVVEAVKNGNASEINPFLNNKIELVIPGKSGVFSKEQAHFILKDFFKDNKVKSFEVLHHGTRQNATFAIGRYECSTDNFRMYFLVKNSDGKPVIHQIRIEKQDE
ncbi:MAG: DUF4783 domain-containing protein [Marinilabilia sp.]